MPNANFKAIEIAAIKWTEMRCPLHSMKRLKFLLRTGRGQTVKQAKMKLNCSLQKQSGTYRPTMHGECKQDGGCWFVKVELLESNLLTSQRYIKKLKSVSDEGTLILVHHKYVGARSRRGYCNTDLWPWLWLHCSPSILYCATSYTSLHSLVSNGT